MTTSSQRDQPDHSGRTAAPVIAFLGTGRMGGPMAANLARAGFAVRAWDRTASHAAALLEEGVTVAASPAEAVQGRRHPHHHAGRRARHRAGLGRARTGCWPRAPA